jgi:hypothetical protein
VLRFAATASELLLRIAPPAPPLPLTFRHWAGISPYTSACAVAETCVFGKQSLEPASCGPLTPDWRPQPTLPRRPFSRSYGANLPSSLTEDRSSTWRVLPAAYRCRCAVRVAVWLKRRRGFSRRPGHPSPSAASRRLPTRLGVCVVGAGFAWHPAAAGRPVLSKATGGWSLPRPPLAFTRRKCRTVHLTLHRLRWNTPASA